MNSLPEHIKEALLSKKTSLGDCPALPPSETMEKLVSSYFNTIDIDGKSTNEIAGELNELVSKCQNEERKNRPALEKLCSDIVNEIFQIPEDTIKVEMHLTDTIDNSGCRALPEEDDGYTFEDIADIENMSDEIYKRRLLNALVEGASETIAYNVKSYVNELFEINPELPAMYAQIIRYSQYLMYALDETKLKDNAFNGGNVKVLLKSAPDKLTVEAEATLFPVLLQNTIKGLLEVAILQGLPDNKDRAYYVMKKADYKLAEVWDSRIGVALWRQIDKYSDKIFEAGLNFFFMEVSSLPVTDVFYDTMKEMFIGTKRGETEINTICDEIIKEKESEDFNDYVNNTNDMYPIEDGYFTEDELLAVRPEWY